MTCFIKGKESIYRSKTWDTCSTIVQLLLLLALVQATCLDHGFQWAHDSLMEFIEKYKLDYINIIFIFQIFQLNKIINVIIQYNKIII
jgi:hypothetical protein